MSEQKSTTSIPDPSPQEQELLNLVSQTLLPNYLKEAGYNVKTSQSTFEDSDEYKSLIAQRKQAAKNPNNGRATAGAFDPVTGEKYPNSNLNPTLDTIDKKIEEARKNFKPYTTYDIGEKLDPQAQYLMDKYGENSKQLKSYQSSQLKSKADQYTQQQEIYKTFQDKTQKYLNGDFTLTPQEQERLTQSTASVKASLDNIFKETLDETTKAYGDFTKVAGENGMTVRDALGAVGAQIEQTGIDMKKALDNVVSTRQELLKQGVVDATGDITKKVSMSAAASGRDPGDPEFQADIQQLVAKQVKQGQLELAGMQAQGELGIAERTGAGLEGVAQQQAAARTGIASKKAGVLSTVDPRISGSIPSQIQMGQSGNQYADALYQQRLNNAQGSIGVPLNYFNQFQQERMAQPTTVQSQDPFSTALSAGLGAVSGAASIYSGFSMANALDDLS